MEYWPSKSLAPQFKFEMPDTVDQCSITLAPTATAAVISSSGMFKPSIPSTYRWSGSVQVRYNRSARPRLLRRPRQLLFFGPPWPHLSRPQMAGFVQCFERHEQLRRCVCVFVATSRNDLNVGHNKNKDLQNFLGHFSFFCSYTARFP